MFSQTDQNKAFYASLFKAIAGTATCVEDIDFHKNEKDSFLEKNRMFMDFEPNQNIKIARIDNRIIGFATF